MENGYEIWKWNIRRSYRGDSPKTAARELAKCNLHLMELQDTRWVEGDSQQMILHFPMDMGELITTY
jgi:hypothetical protein